MIKVYFPKINCGSEIRGIGFYTNFLVENLKKIDDFKLVDNWQEADLIHYTFFDLYFNTLKIFPNKKHVVTIHDVIPLVFKNEYKSGLKGKFRFFLQRLKLRKIDAIITDSFHSASDIKKYLKVNKDKIKVVYLAGNPNLKKPAQPLVQSIKQRLNLPEKYILYVGDINYNKNLINLIKSISLIDKEVKLILVGSNFYPHNIKEWQIIARTIKEYQLNDRIIFFSNIKKNDFQVLSVLYNQALVYVQPSLYEGFGLPVLEAWQCGNLVIASNNSSLAEIGKNFIFKSECDHRDLVRVIQQVLNLDDNLRRKKIKEIQKYLLNFSWLKTAQQTYAIYKDILKK